MHFEPVPPDILERLERHRTIGRAPLAEREWLVAHGRIRRLAAGEYMARQGQTIEQTGFGFEIVLSGHFAIQVDRGAGPRQVMEWQGGDISGLLPFSRMTSSPGDAYCDLPVETLSIASEHFPELIRECPKVTSICVHIMLDRARVFNTSDWQDEKMVSLGKLSAGLAHELNNPASAVTRSAKLLQQSMAEADRAARALALARLDEVQLAAIERVRDACMVLPTVLSRSPLERADREDEIADWLENHDADLSAVESLAETAVTIDVLDELAKVMKGDELDAALDWVAAGCTVRTLAIENERAGKRISDIVGAMKRLTYMDRAATLEDVHIEEGVRDTLTVVAHKARDKSISIKVEVAPDLPHVRAMGGELNQVWMNLIDNALDAVDVGGEVRITVKPEGRCVVVRIIDNGPGIPDEIKPRIFDQFFTTKEPGKGTGLGLEVARTRARGHGGEIDFDSRPGRTEFRVTLPIVEENPAAAAS